MSPSTEARMELDRARIRRESRERDRQFGERAYPWRAFAAGAIFAAATLALWLVTRHG